MSDPHESFVPATSSHYTLSLDLPTSITVCIILVFFISLLCQGLCKFFHWRCPDMRPANYDLEQGDGIRRPDIVSSTSQQAAFYQAIIQNNIRTLETLDSFMRDVGEKRGQRLRPSEKLPPLVRYGSHEMMSSCSDCAICLEDFADGDKCQIFPTCNHTFHSNCIDVWLKKKLTCPICRNILDV